ncbi:precorrin-6A synthase (deacetylating) [Rhodococcoides kroppenstedtii]|uniref:precorrin-6A synthase (deacetylating) n=1 Tax=Rhodococcoides kroppenstedtii TaxID=293050 RepID=UPI0028E96A98|nr:precorrin-6A synthase (deacetylating) [Rhodococcus kroppenstedtii]
MRLLHVIGIGAGDPDQVTVAAVKAMNEVDVFVLIDKGAAKQELVDVRTRILDEHVRRPHRVVEFVDPPRDRTPRDYDAAVDTWHEARARALADLLAAEPDDAVGGMLVWGDPSLYDSTLRVVDRVRARLDEPFEVRVTPGVTSPSALAAAHGTVLNRVGEPVLTTTGRRLREDGVPDGVDAVVVMLDSDCGFLALPDWHVHWGANLGTPDAVVLAGRVSDVGEEIVRVRADLRRRAGWVMDTYLVRRPLGR